MKPPAPEPSLLDTPTICRTTRTHRCPLCGAGVAPGRIRLQAGYGRPLCDRCTQQLGLAPILEAAEAADLLATVQLRGGVAPALEVAIARVRHATSQWALFRLTTTLRDRRPGT